MNWGRAIYIFFVLMSLTTTVGFLFDQNSTVLFIATCINIIATLLKLGIKSTLSTELFISSFVADLHLIPALILVILDDSTLNAALALSIGAVVANIFSIVILLIDIIKEQEEI